MLRSVKYGINGAVLAGLIAAPLVWTAVDKSVTLVVDGHASTVRTTADRVGEVVRAKGYAVTSHDLLAPAASSAIHDGSTIVLRRGRLLNLSIDGQDTSVWTTAGTVREALTQLGYTTSDFVSVSRSQRLPLGATDIAIRTPQSVLVVHDGRRDRVTTTDATVGELLADMDITLDGNDRVSVPPSASLGIWKQIVVQRVGTRTSSSTVKIPFKITKKNDGSLSKGSTRVVVDGRNGQAKITYELIYVDGKLSAKTAISTTMLRTARPEIIAIGTKKIVVQQPTAGSTGSSSTSSNTSSSTSANLPAPTPGSAKAIAKTLLDERGWGSMYGCLVSMWNRESGWNIHAANPSGAYGIPQALPGSKMSSAGPDWQNNAETQIKWGLGYIASRYHDPCNAWAIWQSQGWY